MHWNHISHILWQIFSWPSGILVGNILANIVWEPSRATVARLQLKKQNKELKSHADQKSANLHAHLDEHHEKIRSMITGDTEK